MRLLSNLGHRKEERKRDETTRKRKEKKIEIEKDGEPVIA